MQYKFLISHRNSINFISFKKFIIIKIFFSFYFFISLFSNSPIYIKQMFTLIIHYCLSHLLYRHSFPQRNQF